MTSSDFASDPRGIVVISSRDRSMVTAPIKNRLLRPSGYQEAGTVSMGHPAAGNRQQIMQILNQKTYTPNLSLENFLTRETNYQPKLLNPNWEGTLHRIMHCPKSATNTYIKNRKCPVQQGKFWLNGKFQRNRVCLYGVFNKFS